MALSGACCAGMGLFFDAPPTVLLAVVLDLLLDDVTRRDLECAREAGKVETDPPGDGDHVALEARAGAERRHRHAVLGVLRREATRSAANK